MNSSAGSLGLCGHRHSVRIRVVQLNVSLWETLEDPKQMETLEPMRVAGGGAHRAGRDVRAADHELSDAVVGGAAGREVGEMSGSGEHNGREA